MGKVVITQKMVDSAIEGDIIASGILENSPDGIYLSPTGRKDVKWVAVRGYIPDWAVYVENLYYDEDCVEDISYHWEDYSIARMGDKLCGELVFRLCDVDDEAKASYRK